MPTSSGVTSLKQLEGKTLGVTGIPFNRTMLEYCLKKAGVDVSKVKIVIVGFTPMPLLLSKRIDGLGDAITWSEPAMFNVQLGKPADDKSTYKYFAFYQNGVPRYYTLGVVATEDMEKRIPSWRAASCVRGRKDWIGPFKTKRAPLRGCGSTIPRSTKQKPSPTSRRSRAFRKAPIRKLMASGGRTWPCGQSKRSSCATRV